MLPTYGVRFQASARIALRRCLYFSLLFITQTGLLLRRLKCLAIADFISLPASTALMISTLVAKS